MSALADGGKREGMVERPNNPEEKVQELQRQLWRCAKRSRSRRFHALYDRIWRGDVLLEAWRRVKGNGEIPAGCGSAHAQSGELIGKLCAGNRHAQFERRCWERVALSDTAPAIDQ